MCAIVSYQKIGVQLNHSERRVSLFERSVNSSVTLNLTSELQMQDIKEIMVWCLTFQNVTKHLRYTLKAISNWSRNALRRVLSILDFLELPWMLPTVLERLLFKVES